jgi:hypothetical protein
MRGAVVANGPSRVAFTSSDGYSYSIGCNIPWTKVDSTVILDSNVIERWSRDLNLISCPAFFTARAWRSTDEYKIREYILNNNLFIDLMPDVREFFSAGHVAAQIMCENDFTELDIYGVDSLFKDTVESFTNTLVHDHNPDSERQRIVHWRLNWDRLQNDYPEVTFNFIRK